MCGSYYVHSNIANIKGSIHAYFFKLSRFQYFLALPFLSDLLLHSLGIWLSAHNPSSWVSKNTCVCVCVFCFLSCLLSFHLSFVWNYSYHTSTELLARYKCMWISHFTSICLPNVFRKKYVLLVYCSLLTSFPPYLYVQSRHIQPCILHVNYFLTHKQYSCETFNYLCWWHLSWPTPTRFLPSPPYLSGNFLHFPSIICMCV